VLKNVLFLCTGNSARSILAEAYLNAAAKGRYRAYSAGSKPTGHVNPLAIETLKNRNIETQEARSKSWNEFAAPGAPKMDLVVTVCDNAAGEACPVWPGAPARAHWGVDDPAAVQGSDAEKRAAFDKAFRELKAKIDAWLAT
jgi:protein-tyrosine-phosphatase